MSPLKRLLPLVLAMLVASAISACGGSGKLSEQKATTLNGEGFSVNMPGKPTRRVSTVQTPAGPLQLTLFLSKGASEAFSIGGGRFPARASLNLDGAVRGEAAGVHGTVRNVLSTTYQRFPARDARITAESNGTPITIFERTILANGEYLNLQFLQQGFDVKSPPASYATFLASLKIT